MPFCVRDVRREDVVRSRDSGASPTRAAMTRITPRTTGSSGQEPWAWSHQRSSPSRMEPAPSPSREANGPHSWGTIQTWIIAHSPTLTSGGRQVPSELVGPATWGATGSGVKQRCRGCAIPSVRRRSRGRPRGHLRSIDSPDVLGTSPRHPQTPSGSAESGRGRVRLHPWPTTDAGVDPEQDRSTPHVALASEAPDGHATS